MKLLGFAVPTVTAVLLGSLAPATALTGGTAANSFGPGDAAWDKYYAHPSNQATWAPFCKGGGASFVASVKGVPACGPTPAKGGTKIYLPDNGGPVSGFQCVELAERYLYVKYGWKPLDQTNGAEVVKHYATQDHISITKNNTVGHAPVVGDVMSFSTNSDFSGIGHTAVVSATSVTASGNGTVTIIGENQNIRHGYNGFTAGSETMTVTKWKVKSFDSNTYIEWLNNSGATTPASTVYVANAESNTVTPISTATNTAGPAIKVGKEPSAIAITPNGKTAYVVNGDTAGTVTPISTATNTAGPAINVGGWADAIAITPNGATVYVANGDPAGTVTPISTATNTAGPAINVGSIPTAIAITPNGATAYVVNGQVDSNTVTPIATATNTAGPAIKVGESPAEIAITPDGKTAYVASYGPNNGPSTVTPIATATNTAGPAIKVGLLPYAIAITPNGATAYTANDGPNTVTPISTATNKTGPAIKVGESPNRIAITPSGATAYVVNQNSGTVTPISTATNKASATIQVGKDPLAIAITP